MSEKTVTFKIEEPKFPVLNITYDKKTGEKKVNPYGWIPTLMQDGHRSKTSFQTAPPEQTPKDIECCHEKPNSKTIKSETINKYKQTYRSGYQHTVANSSGLETFDSMLLMGSSDPKLIKTGKIFGNDNGADGWNGWKKSDLYRTNYENIDGVGKF